MGAGPAYRYLYAVALLVVLGVSHTQFQGQKAEPIQPVEIKPVKIGAGTAQIEPVRAASPQAATHKIYQHDVVSVLSGRRPNEAC